jgi:hypothetical protein
MTIINVHRAYLITIVLTIIFAASIISVTLRPFGVAQAQINNSNITSSLTSEQKAAMCNTSDKFVNDTESRICGIPPTPTNTTSRENTTIGAGVP